MGSVLPVERDVRASRTVALSLCGSCRFDLRNQSGILCNIVLSVTSTLWMFTESLFQPVVLHRGASSATEVAASSRRSEISTRRARQFGRTNRDALIRHGALDPSSLHAMPIRRNIRCAFAVVSWLIAIKIILADYVVAQLHYPQADLY